MIVMKVFTSILVLGLFVLSSCNNSKKDSKLYMCTCEEIPDLGDSTQVVSKISYTYVVRSDSVPSCCNEPVESAYTGYKMIWENEAPGHPTVWGRSADDLIKFDAVESQLKGCEIESKHVMVVDMSNPSPSFKDLYPELVE